MRVRQIPIFNDNYTYLLIDESTSTAAAIDPADADVVAQVIAEEGVRPTHVLCTHHHWDHAGGNEAFLKRFPDVSVVASEVDAPNIHGVTRRVVDGERVDVGALTGQVLFVPCHTRGHVAFVFGDALFCGDMLFVGGCGRFFEGDAAQMHHALNIVFAKLAPETKVYCGHEYTLSNLRFAAHLEPDNVALQAKLAWAQSQRDKDLPTVPSTLGEERTYNPFMRVTEVSVQRAVGASDPVEVMAKVRAKKNSF